MNWIINRLYRATGVISKKNLLIVFNYINVLTNFQQCEREKLFSIPKSDFYPGHFSWSVLKFEELLRNKLVKEAIEERPEKYHVLIENKNFDRK